MPPITFTNATVRPDVEIRILDDVYHLHSTNLRTSSQFFDRGLSSTWWKDENTHDGLDGIRYRYALVFDEGGLDMSMVEPVPAKKGLMTGADSHSEIDTSHFEAMSMDTPTSDVPVGDNESEKKRIDEAIVNLRRSYATLFRMFYNKITDEDFSPTLSRYEHLVNLADQYCCLPAVASLIESLLIKWSRPNITLLPYQCVPVMLLAIKIRSKDLYNDAFVHFVGQLVDDEDLEFSVVWDQRRHLPPAVLATAMEHFVSISMKRTEIDRQLARYCSTRQGRQQREVKEDIQKLGQIYDQWFDERYGEAKLYREIEAIPSLDDSFESLQALVARLTKNNLVLDRSVDFEHLTCTKIDGETEYPWDDKEDW